MSPLWLAVLAALMIGLFVPIVLRPFLRRFGVADDPNERSSHATRTLRGGGIAPLLAMIAAAVICVISDPRLMDSPLPMIVVASGAVSVLGLVEDIVGLSIVVRIGGQAGIGAAVAWSVSGDNVSWGFLLFTLGFIAYVNIANFMDGINGISGMHGLVVGAAYITIGLVDHIQWLVLIGAILAVAFTSFLPWNLTQPGLFLGDVGSYLLGGSVAASVIAGVISGIPLMSMIAPLTIYLVDALTTLGRRAVRGEPVLRPHRTHVYQRLTDTGLTHLSASSVVALFSAGCAAVGLLMHTRVIAAGWGFIVIAALAGVYLLMPRWRGHQLPRQASGDLLHVHMPYPAPARRDYVARKWVVLGATGFVGSALMEHLRTIGVHETVALRAPRLAFDPRIADPTAIALAAREHPERGRLVKLFMGADVVVNAAGLATPDAAADEALYGANALLPALVASAARQAGVCRAIHVSSAAVQGNRAVLDATLDASPFSPYSRSKALGERAFLATASIGAPGDPSPDLVVVRATSVQGRGRSTTTMLRRIAQSPLSSVAAPGTQPSVVSSIAGLVHVLTEVGTTKRRLPPILLQPWEGLSAREVLRSAGARDPLVLPVWICRSVLGIAYTVGRFMPAVTGATRRVELMWFGQGQRSQYDPELFSPTPVSQEIIRRTLAEEEE